MNDVERLNELIKQVAKLSLVVDSIANVVERHWLARRAMNVYYGVMRLEDHKEEMQDGR